MTKELITLCKNNKLANARRLRNDEFYTQLSTIENEMKHHLKHFKDKVIYLNCDNPRFSKFWTYFTENFDKLGLKKLIATYYSDNHANPSEKWTLTNGGGDTNRTFN